VTKKTAMENTIGNTITVQKFTRITVISLLNTERQKKNRSQNLKFIKYKIQEKFSLCLYLIKSMYCSLNIVRNVVFLNKYFYYRQNILLIIMSLNWNFEKNLNLKWVYFNDHLSNAVCTFLENVTWGRFYNEMCT